MEGLRRLFRCVEEDIQTFQMFRERKRCRDRVKDLNYGMKEVNSILKILEKGKKHRYYIHDYCDCLVADDTGSYKLVLCDLTVNEAFAGDWVMVKGKCMTEPSYVDENGQKRVDRKNPYLLVGAIATDSPPYLTYSSLKVLKESTDPDRGKWEDYIEHEDIIYHGWFPRKK